MQPFLWLINTLFLEIALLVLTFSFLAACVYNKYLVCLCARKGRYHEIIIMYLLPLSSSLLLATIHFRPGSFYRTNIVFYPFSFPFVSQNLNFQLFIPSFFLFSLPLSLSFPLQPCLLKCSVCPSWRPNLRVCSAGSVAVWEGRKCRPFPTCPASVRGPGC